MTDLSDNSYTTLWDGTNSSGVRVPDGRYSVTGIVTYTADGNTYSHTSDSHRVIVTEFEGEIDAENTDNRLLFPEDPPSDSASGASGASGGKGPRTDPRSTPTITVTGPRANITYNVTAVQGFTPSSVYAKIYSDGTEIKLIDDFPGSSGNVFTSSWDGTNSAGDRVSMGDYSIRGYVNYEGRSLGTNGVTRVTWEHESSTHTIAVGTDFYPIAEIEIDGEDFSVDVPIQFYGRNSHDPDDGTDPGVGIHSYSWDFGGEPQNDADPTDSTDINPTVTYWQPGEKTVILTVWDNDPVAGASGSGSGTSNSRRGKQRQARRTFNVAGSITVKILSSTEHTPGSETSLAIDTEGVPGRGPDPVTGEDPTTATIYYEISGGRVQDFPRREITLEIDDDDDPSNEPITVIVLSNLTGIRDVDWDGNFVVVPPATAPDPPYGMYYAHIRLKINLDADPDWEKNYPSNAHPITVYSYPVADAGEDRVVAIDTTTDSVTVSFDGSNSSDPDDGTSASVDDVITAWNWSFTGTDLTQDSGSDTATTKTVDTPYRSAGVKTATLTVTDNDDPALDDEDMAEITVIDVRIDDPTNNEKLILTTDPSLPMNVQGNFLPTTIPGPHDLNWEITVGGSTYSTTTGSGQQGTIPINAADFPSSNNDFGPNNMKLTVTYNPVIVSREQPVKVFFKPGGFENGATITTIEANGQLTISVPNWYVFWKQTPANLGTHQYDGRSTAYGYYRPGESHFYIGKAVKTIDDFAKTCLHEFNHQQNFHDWWIGNPQIPGGYTLANRLTHDPDNDLIPTYIEQGLGFNPALDDSNGNNIDDFEELAEAAEDKWDEFASAGRRQAAHNADWSVGGFQWR